jgi:hypothetical protein
MAEVQLQLLAVGGQACLYCRQLLSGSGCCSLQSSRDACRALHPGWDLVVYRSASEQAGVEGVAAFATIIGRAYGWVTVLLICAWYGALQCSSHLDAVCSTVV